MDLFSLLVLVEKVFVEMPIFEGFAPLLHELEDNAALLKGCQLLHFALLEHVFEGLLFYLVVCILD